MIICWPSHNFVS